MSKYDLLWQYIQGSGMDDLKLSFDRIRAVAGVPLDHSFLRYKRELEKFGYRVVKISMKEQTVLLEKIRDGE